MLSEIAHILITHAPIDILFLHLFSLMRIMTRQRTPRSMSVPSFSSCRNVLEALLQILHEQIWNVQCGEVTAFVVF
jgi:hypothetical protein